MNPQPVPVHRKKSWADRHGAWVASVCLHFCVIVLLVTQSIEPAPSRETVLLPAITVTLEPASPDSRFDLTLALPDEPDAAAPLPDPAQWTSPEPAAPEDSNEPRSETAGSPDAGAHDSGLGATPPPLGAPSGLGDGGTALDVAGAFGASPDGPLVVVQAAALPDPGAMVVPGAPEAAEGDVDAALRAEDARVGEILAGYRKAAAGDRAAAYGERREIDKRIQKLELASAAVSQFPGYGGARTNVIRTLDLGNVDATLSQKVMDRYNIRIVHRYVEAMSSVNYLSSVATGNAVFHPSTKPGEYEVFEISPEAHRRMVYLEQNYLVTHGYDPASTKLDRVDFGIVETTAGTWDLGILNIKINQFGQVGIAK